MADSSLPVGDTGESLQTYKNLVGGVQVHSEAQTPTDEFGVPFDQTNPQYVALTAAQISTLTPPSNTGYALDGTDITTPTAMPAGGVGIRGWLSAIWTKLNGSLAVTGAFFQATQPVSGTFWQATQPVSIAATLPTAPSASATSVGTTPYSNTALSNIKQAVKASAGNLYGYHLYNPNTVSIFVQFFDLAAASVTVGTTAPTFVLTIPATATSPATLDMQGSVPIGFSNAITIAATLTATGAGAPATALNCSLFYK